MLSFRDGQLMIAAGQVADLTDDEIAAHPEAIFTDVQLKPDLVDVLTDGASLYDRYGNPLAIGGGGGAGTSFRVGRGAPSSTLGIVGDSYLDLDTDDLYGPKTLSGWGSSIGNIHGLVGSTGTAGGAGVAGLPGTPGEAGHSLLSFHGLPPANQGVDGDTALNLDTGDMYGPKAGGSWGTIQGNLHGAVGIAGAQGIQGIQGIQGDPGNVELAYAYNDVGLALTTAAQDIPGVQIPVTAPSRPFYLRGEALVQINKGTAATGAACQVQLKIFDTANMATAIRTVTITQAVATAGPLHTPVHYGKRISLPAGTVKTYKLQALISILPTNGGGTLLAAPDNECWLGAYQA